MAPIDVIYRYDEKCETARVPPADPDAAQRRLEEGNREFAALFDGLTNPSVPRRRIVPIDAGDWSFAQDGNKVPVQRPFAAVVGCSDARVPIELIFSEGPNDLFVVRVAGNGLGADTIGSLRYAIEHLGSSLKLIVVLGHSGCGAVSAAVDVFLNPSGYLELATDHALRGILDHLLIVVHASARKLLSTFGSDACSNPRYREALIETSSVANTALAAYTIHQEIADRHSRDLRTAYGVYMIENRRLWAPKIGLDDSTGLAPAPTDFESFLKLADAIVRSERVLSILGLASAGQHRQ